MALMMSASEISAAGRVRSALAADEPGPPKLSQDRLEELAWYLLRTGKLIGRDVAVTGRGKLDRGTQRIIGPG